MRGMYSGRAVWLGWVIPLVYAAHQFVTTRLPRTDKALPLREDLRGWHYLVGALLFAAVLARVIVWVREGRVAPPAGFPASAWGWGRRLAAASYTLILAAPVLGLLWAWSDGLPVHFGPTSPIPSLVGESRPLWMFSGYFHSGLGFMLLLLNLTTVLSGGYFLIRFGRGLLAAFPPGYGAFAFIGLTATVYAFATFRSPEPGPRAVLVFWVIAAAVWLLSRLRKHDPGRVRSTSISPSAGAAMAAAVLGIVALGGYGPHALFKVTPFPPTPPVASVDGREWHAAAVTRVALAPETPLERQVRAETFKWCAFCHTMKPGAKHLVGPNLHAIIGQRAGSVPGFGYSEAMVAARGRGLVWTEANIAAYIADPEHFLPGTTMAVSSGPIPDPAVQRSVLNILKREAMPASAVDP